MLAVLLGAAFAGSPSRARADFALQIYDGSTLITPVSMTTSSGITYSATTSNFQLTFGAAVTNSPGVAGVGNMQVGNIAVTRLNSQTTTPPTLTIVFTATDYTTPNAAPLFLSSSASLVGTLGSGAVSYQSYVDTNNTMFGGFVADSGVTTTGLQQSGIINSNPTNAAALATASAMFSPSLPVKYSLTSVTKITLNGAGDSISMVGSTAVTAPAPAGLVLALTGLPCLGLAWLRRRKQQA